MRTGGFRPSGRTRALPVPRDKERLHMPGSPTTPGHMSARAVAPIRVAFHTCDSVGPRDVPLSRLNGWPMHSPTDASPVPSQEPAHGSGPMRFATPSSWRTFTAYSLPVSPAHHMPGSPTTPGHMSARAVAPIRVAFHTCDSVGPRDVPLYRGRDGDYSPPPARIRTGPTKT